MSQTFHLASHKGWSNDLQTIVMESRKNYYDILFFYTLWMGLLILLDPTVKIGHIQRLKDFITYSKTRDCYTIKGWRL